MGKKIDLTGQQFGRLLVVKKSDEIRDHHTVWECSCSCGSEKKVLVKSDALKKGNTKSCGCWKKEINSAMGKANRNPDRNKVINKSLHTVFRCHAKRAKNEFFLTIDELCEFIYSKCYYCNCEPSNQFSYPYSDEKIMYNGIDRIDNTIGYVYNNCVSCCKRCNVAKNNMTMIEYITWLNNVYINFSKNALFVELTKEMKQNV